MRYNTVNDLSNFCTATLYNKFGLGRVDLESPDILNVDVFPAQTLLLCGQECQDIGDRRSASHFAFRCTRVLEGC